jgi:hypothetical protein
MTANKTEPTADTIIGITIACHVFITNSCLKMTIKMIAANMFPRNSDSSNANESKPHPSERQL